MNQKSSKSDLYRDFLSFVQSESKRERSAVNRRMIGVFIWCFIVPALVLASGILLIRAGILPRTARNVVDSIFLLFPLLYSVGTLLGEWWRQAKNRKPGTAGLDPFLRQSLTDADWREETAQKLQKSISAAGTEEWIWISSNFSQDLENMRYRTRFLTALSGTVLFLVSQGMDLLEGPKESEFLLGGGGIFSWLKSVSGDFTQMIGLALFLILLYLSWSQTLRSLEKFQGSLKILSKG